MRCFNPHLAVHERILPAVALALAFVLTGCGAGYLSQQGSSGTLAIQGKASGGMQPIVGATVQLYAAGETGYGSAATPLLTSTVTTGAGGAFTLTGLYTCPSESTQVYLTARQGNPGLAGGINNAAITEIAALGRCDSLSSSTFINMNELTTVAAVWALAPFMTSYDHIGASSTNAAGLANAFIMASDLVSTGSGQAPGNLPVGASVPIAKLHTLANVLASCVNTEGGAAGDTTACGKLFAAAANGGANPTEVVAAALSIVKHPAGNVSSIFNLASGVAPYQSQLSTAPNDWTLAVNFPAGNTATSDIAVDRSGNVFIATGTALYELAPSGAVAGAVTSMAGTRVAVDATGNIWVGSGADSTMTLKKMPSSLGAPAVFTHAAVDSQGGYNFSGLALDGLGNAWYTCDNCGSVSKSSPAGVYLGSYAVSSSHHATNVSIDMSERAWLGNYDYSKVNVFANDGTGAPSAPFDCGTCGYPASLANDGSGNTWMTGYNLTRMSATGAYTNFAADPQTNGGLFSPAAVAIDGAGSAWVSNSTAADGSAGSLTLITADGAPVSPPLGYISEALQAPGALAVDGSGNVWTLNTSNPSVTVFVGAAIPVVTPLALGVKNGTLGSRP